MGKYPDDISGSQEGESASDSSLLDRILSRAGTALDSTSHAPQVEDTAGEWERLERQLRSRPASTGFDIDDISEVEYREVRLEKVVLVGVYSSNRRAAEVSLRELAALSETAGAQVLDGLLQGRPLPDAATYLGHGKAEELAATVAALEADTVIVDGELAPSQRRALEDIVKVKVIDRTAVILDIFAQHAKSTEGKAQVELAQLEYLLPRLRGWGESLSRQAGGRVAGGVGIGGRGPGETKIELDRRRIRTRMAKLRRQLKTMGQRRETKRAARRASAVAAVAIVGYTNAGKSSLLNRLTDAEVMVDDSLFATLDPTTRSARTADGRAYTLSDTVGFVANLPTQLVEAFRSTLEEAAGADLIMHVLDGAHPDPDGQIQVVREVLGELGEMQSIPELLVINKIDLADPDALMGLRSRYPEAVCVSAHTGEGIAQLREKLEAMLPAPGRFFKGTIFMVRGDLIEQIRRHGQLQKIDYRAEGIYLEAQVDPRLEAQLKEAMIRDDTPEPF